MGQLRREGDFEGGCRPSRYIVTLGTRKDKEEIKLENESTVMLIRN